MIKLYAAGAALLLLIAAGLAVFYYRNEAQGERDRRIVAELNLKAAADANALLSRELDIQRERAEITEESATKLAVTLSDIREKLVDANAEIAKLRTEDASVNSFLDLDVPPALGRLLDD